MAKEVSYRLAQPGSLRGKTTLKAGRALAMAACICMSVPLQGHAATTTPTTGVRNIHATFSGNPQHEVTVSWRTAAPLSPPEARYAAAGNIGVPAVRAGSSVDSAGGFNHHVRLADLQAGTRYTYQVAVPGGGWGPVCRFQTAPPNDAPFTFAVIGDVQGTDQPSQKWRTACNWLASRDDLAFAVLVGDLVNTGGDQRQWDAFFDPAGGEAAPSFFHSMVMMPIPGNHDYYARAANNTTNDEGIRLFLDQFRLPDNGPYPEWNGRFHHFAYGSAGFVMLDTEGAADTRARMQREQTVWMKTIAWEAKPWNLAFMHRPTYPFLRHKPSGEGRTVWRPHFFDPYVNVVFNGHNHSHAVSVPLRAARLHGMTGGRGFAGHWQAEVKTDCPSGLHSLLLLEENDLIRYAGCEAAGRSVCTFPQGSFNNRAMEARRAITPIATTLHKELWMGFLYSKKSGWFATGQGGWRLTGNDHLESRLQVDTMRDAQTTGTVGRFRIRIGQATANSREQIAVEGSVQAPQGTFFVLARFVFETDRTTGYLKQYASPQPLPRQEPAEWDAILEVAAFPETYFDTLTLLGDDRSRASLMDEFRLGATLAAVLPPQAGIAAAATAWVEERFDATPSITPDDGVVYYDAGGINFSDAPADFWYIRHRQEKDMPLIGLVNVHPERMTVKTVFYDTFGDYNAGDVLHAFELKQNPDRTGNTPGIE